MDEEIRRNNESTTDSRGRVNPPVSESELENGEISAELSRTKEAVSEILSQAQEELVKFNLEYQSYHSQLDLPIPNAATVDDIRREMHNLLSRPSDGNHLTKEDLLRAKALGSHLTWIIEEVRSHLERLKERRDELNSDLSAKESKFQIHSEEEGGKSSRKLKDAHESLPRAKRAWHSIKRRSELNLARGIAQENIALEREVENAREEVEIITQRIEKVRDELSGIIDKSGGERLTSLLESSWRDFIREEIENPARQRIEDLIEPIYRQIKEKVVDDYLSTTLKERLEKKVQRTDVKELSGEEFEKLWSDSSRNRFLHRIREGRLDSNRTILNEETARILGLRPGLKVFMEYASGYQAVNIWDDENRVPVYSFPIEKVDDIRLALWDQAPGSSFGPNYQVVSWDFDRRKLVVKDSAGNEKVVEGNENLFRFNAAQYGIIDGYDGDISFLFDEKEGGDVEWQAEKRDDGKVILKRELGEYSEEVAQSYYQAVKNALMITDIKERARYWDQFGKTNLSKETEKAYDIANNYIKKNIDPLLYRLILSDFDGRTGELNSWNVLPCPPDSFGCQKKHVYDIFEPLVHSQGLDVLESLLRVNI